MPSSFWSFSNVVLASILLRVCLILYSEWHDARSLVKYTDVDYRVFSDAAHYIWTPTPVNLAQGPLNRLLGLGECAFTSQPIAHSVLTMLAAHMLGPRTVIHRYWP
jgi:GPI mannosyltransferase 1 subunit M